MKKITLQNLQKIRLLSILVMLFATTIVFSQTNYNVQFQDETVVIQENINSFQWDQMPESSKFNGGYYGWVQFYQTPTQDIQNLFKTNNLQLIEYIPNRTYLFYFPENTSVALLRTNGVRAIVPVAGEYKLSSELKHPPFADYAIEGNNILVTLQYHKNVNAQYVINDLANQQISVRHQYKGSNNIDLVIPNNCLETLSSQPYVKWIELIVAPSIPDDTRGRSLHKANGLDTQTSAGRNYTGSGIGVMVRDDGIVGPHIDFQGRIDNSTASGTGQTHGDGVGGIMAGAGNLDPSMRGMAAESNVFVVNYEPNFLDTQTVTLINNGNVQITNSSYSNGCNAGYTTITQTVDSQTRNIPTLLHVFSAGNSNNSNCGYGAGNQWGNITGGHKQGKNVIATANVFFDGSLVGSSSRGPAHDGRIKPDIAANGQNQNSTNENNTYQVFGGTSGAAPGIAGISAQLYQAYGDINGGAFPPSALIKATLMNTTNEAGNIGPDFKFGWGIVNGLRAGMLIEDGRFLSDDISQGGTNNHSINVPAGTTQVRFMLYWSDPEAAPNANPALVNDLDLVVTDPSSGAHLPWILNSTPDPVLLDTPATTGADHLNNVEQVLINNPAAGNYDLEISGFNVPTGPQEYFVVYEIISENLTVTYPNAGESFVPGETESIHWDATNTTADFDLEYSTDNGATWNAIATVGPSVTNYGWNIPATVSGDALLRVTSGAFSDTSDENFSIANLVTNVSVTQVCPDMASFSWTAVANAESYDFYMLGTTAMEVADNVATNSISVAITDPTAPIWAAVVAKNATAGWVSRRTIAINHPGGLLNCSLNNDVAAVSIDNNPGDFATVCTGVSDVVIVASFLNSGIDPQSNFDVSYQLDSDPPVVESYTGTINSGQQVSYSFVTPLTITASGSYTLTVTVDLTGDENNSNDTATLDFYAVTEATQLDFEETFETDGFPPPAWTIENPDEDDTWLERVGITGSDGNPTITGYVNNFSYNSPGQEDYIVTEIFDLTNATSATMTFDLAKAQYSAGFSDAMRVDISTDCGTTYSQIYYKEGLDLSTISGYSTASNWAPGSASDWRNESVDISGHTGGMAIFRFVNINGFGNSTIVDNINISGLLGIAENNLASSVSMYPNPATNNVMVSMNQTAFETLDISIVNSLGQQLQKVASSNSSGIISIDVSSYASGLYFVNITVDGVTATKKLLVK
ncbi:S8 family serine peptidase [Ulvibacter antarcticus]|uniref:Putative secreted protein (Por secretion system target) n=1 Tax=Ulvibacter antarcticus TaxID=442714 RepID=A0A3L9YYZ1_9FLAO|nr:S8 family serine peptidase [Ulvibacter antarcticus]RMA65941.1 putative secreted protein (Por secretion system target) [Ulvibacter antarcticus]